MPHAFGRRLALGVAFGALLYLLLAAYAGWDELRAALGMFRWRLLLPALLLSSVNYLVRFGRWQMYLGAAGVPVPAGLSLRVFLAGLVMSVTPGKLGEVLKAYLVRLHTGAPVTRTGPIVVAERVTDLLALVVLLFVGSLVYRSGWPQLLASGVVTLGLVTALASTRVARLAIVLVERLPGLRHSGEKLERAHASMRDLLHPRLLAPATLLGAAAWFAECLGFALVLHGFGIAVPAARATFVYAFSTLVGALLLLPGGLGGTEGSMVALVVAGGAARPAAVGATFVTRLATLWFAVLVGALVLLADRRLMVGSSARGGTPDAPDPVPTRETARCDDSS